MEITIKEDINIEIAQKIFLWKIDKDNIYFLDNLNNRIRKVSDFKPTNSKLDAFLVLDEMIKQGYRVVMKIANEKAIGVIAGEGDVGDWFCNFIYEDKTSPTYHKELEKAICISALNSIKLK